MMQGGGGLHVRGGGVDLHKFLKNQGPSASIDSQELLACVKGCLQMVFLLCHGQGNPCLKQCQCLLRGLAASMPHMSSVVGVGGHPLLRAGGGVSMGKFLFLKIWNGKNSAPILKNDGKTVRLLGELSLCRQDFSGTNPPCTESPTKLCLAIPGCRHGKHACASMNQCTPQNWSGPPHGAHHPLPQCHTLPQGPSKATPPSKAHVFFFAKYIKSNEQGWPPSGF